MPETTIRIEHSTPKNLELVLLDRDGVLCHDSPNYIRSAADWRSIDGSVEAIARLNQAGIRCALCTNQAGIGRGIFDFHALADIHQCMTAQLDAAGARLELIRYCPHHPDAGCGCRKPAAGLLEDCLTELVVPATNALFIGDSLSDMQAAQRAGVQGALVNYAKTGRDSNAVERAAHKMGITLVAANLASLVEVLLA